MFLLSFVSIFDFALGFQKHAKFSNIHSNLVTKERTKLQSRERSIERIPTRKGENKVT